jgi:hypothetical protein
MEQKQFSWQSLLEDTASNIHVLKFSTSGRKFLPHGNEYNFFKGKFDVHRPHGILGLLRNVNWYRGRGFSFPYRQCGGSGMFIPDPDLYPSRIPDPKTAMKDIWEKKFVVLTFL